MNVSGLIVKVLPADMESALAALKDSRLCDVHAYDREKGAIVVTIEGKDAGKEMDKMRAIEKLPHVRGVALVYAAGEDDPLDPHRATASTSAAVSDMLNEDRQ